MHLQGAIVGRSAAFLLGLAIASIDVTPAPAETGDRPAPLTLRTRIPLPGVYGRIDHFGWDSKRGILIVSALGNNTIEIVDQWKRVRTIEGLKHPQASVYLPGLDRIVVSTESGELRLFDAETYFPIKTLDFGAQWNTDNIRYDAVNKLIYVGYGARDLGAIAVVDAVTMERRDEYRLGSHPESFQLETKGSRIYVALPDQRAIAVIDRKTGAIMKLAVAGNANSHALAFDEVNRRLFTAALQPGRFAIMASDSGKLVAEFPCVLGVDDLWFDAARRRIYATGAGAIDTFQQADPDHYSLLARIDAGLGAGSTSLHVKTRTQDSLFMSRPNMLPQGGSEVLLFYVND